MSLLGEPSPKHGLDCSSCAHHACGPAIRGLRWSKLLPLQSNGRKMHLPPMKSSLSSDASSVGKTKIQDSARIGSAFVYRHLKNKTTEEPPNLVTDPSGNVIAAPADAIAEINSQWDEVYSANLGFPHPLKMLDIVWPHIHRFAVDYPVPDISARALQGSC